MGSKILLFRVAYMSAKTIDKVKEIWSQEPAWWSPLGTKSKAVIRKKPMESSVRQAVFLFLSWLVDMWVSFCFFFSPPFFFVKHMYVAYMLFYMCTHTAWLFKNCMGSGEMMISPLDGGFPLLIDVEDTWPTKAGKCQAKLPGKYCMEVLPDYPPGSWGHPESESDLPTEQLV